MKKLLLILALVLPLQLCAQKIEWKFNTNGNLEGWAPTRNTATVTGGVLKMSNFSTADPYIRYNYPSGASISGSSRKYVVISIKNNTSATVGQFFWFFSGGNSYVEFPITPNDTQFKEYIINLSGNTNWTSKAITGIRFDIPKTAPVAGSVDIDNIKLYSIPPLRLATISSPSLMFTAAEINQHQINYATATGSLRAAYDNLIIRCNSGLNINNDPYLGTDPYAFYDNTLGPAGVVRNLALGYAITGNNAYGSKAVQLMTKWATGCKDVTYVTNTATGMLLTRSLFQMMCAYDILKNTSLMTTAQKALVKEWFTKLVPQIRNSVDYWHNNDYFYQQDYQNHVVSHTLGMLALGLVLENQSVINYALDLSDNPRNLRVLMTGCIFMQGDATHHREVANSAPPVNGEIYDRYRHDTAPLKGLQYSHLTLTQLAISAKICYNNGLDMFSFVAPGGENLKLSFDYYADYYRLKNSCIKSNYYCGETSRIGIVGDDPGLFELGLNYYPNSTPIKNLIYSGAFNRSTDYMDILGYTRLYSASVDDNDSPPALASNKQVLLINEKMSVGPTILTEVDKNDFAVYPNPVKEGKFSIQVGEHLSKQSLDIHIYDTGGKLLHTEKALNANQSVYIIEPGKMFDPGLYIIKIGNVAKKIKWL